MLKVLTRTTIILFLFISAIAEAQNVRGFYLQNIGTWLGNTTKENDILSYAQGNGFNYINFYDLNDLDWSSATDKNHLASFISRGRTQYGISEWGAVVENYAYVVSNILPYNNSRASSNEKFDIINLEFEYWVSSSVSALYCSRYLTPNGLHCDSSGAYKFAWKQLKLIDSACATNGLISEFYLGWPNRGQMEQIGSVADRIFLHAYRPTDNDVFSYSRNRLSWLGGMSSPKKVIVLFSSESAFMGPWLSSHPITRPYQTYSDDLASETASWKNNIDLKGYHWFTYAHMPHTMVAIATITASGPLTFCPGGSVTLTANSGSAYLWSPGGQTTRSITVSSAGSYTVKVTSSGGTQVTSMPTVVSISTTGVTPTVTVSGQTSCGDATLTSSTASSYHWSNGETTQSITVSSSGTYSVTTGSGTCVATSSPTAVTVNPAPATPTITSSGPLSFCNGGQVTLTSTTATGYRWSNGVTTRSIVVSASGNYTVNAYNGPNCFTTSAVTTVTENPLPPKPVITPTGSTTLSATNLDVILTSSASSGNEWSTGALTTSITVNVTGTYSVTATDSNGCQKVSNPIVVDGVGCVPPAIPVITLSGPSALMPGQTVTLTSSIANEYLWSTGETTQSIVVSQPGDYSLRVFSSIGCYTLSMPVTITEDLSTGISTLAGSSDLALFPNPSSGIFSMRFSLEQNVNLRMSLTDISGHEIIFQELKGTAGVNLIDFNEPGLAKGVYFVNLVSNEQRVTRIVVIE